MVVEHLERDVILAQALDRGIVNHAAAARWIVENVIPDTHWRTIVSALRRWEPTRAWQQDRGDFRALEDTHVSIASGWVVLDVPRSVGTHQNMVKLRHRIHANKPIHALLGQQSIRVAVPTEVAHEARAMLGYKNIEQEFQSAAQLGFRRHDPDRGLHLPLSTSLSLHTFGSAGIRVLGSFGFQDECYVFVPQEDVERGYHLALNLAGDESQ